MVIKLLYQTHRWVGIALAVFMVSWLASGLAIIYGKPLPTTLPEQLAHAAPLRPEAGWLSLGEAWRRKGGEGTVLDGRLTRIDGAPIWLVEDEQHQRTALSALDGSQQTFTPEQAQRIAQNWVGTEAKVRYQDSQDAITSLRNYATFKPFHRLAVDDANGTELLISARTGDVLQVANRWQRGVYLVGNWLHTFRFLDSAGAGDSRRDVLLWIGLAAAIASLTGLIIGWLRWRPRWGRKPQYPQGRTQPYRQFWLRWHFWSGLIGGTLAVTWSLSGYLSTNPWQIFSNAAPSRAELGRYLGGPLPQVVAAWQPSTTLPADTVAVDWRRVGNQAVLFAYKADGQRTVQAIDGAAPGFDQAELIAAAQRLGKNAPIAGQTLLADYDSYYYPNHRQGLLEKPLPVLKIDLADAAHTSLYVDPQDASLLQKVDDSRRTYRWLFSALHFWDFGLLHVRPLWDGWLLTWIGFGLVLSVSSVVIGWRRLKRTFRRPEPEEQSEPATAPTFAIDQAGLSN